MENLDSLYFCNEKSIKKILGDNGKKIKSH